jgi:hypothetical protein
MFNDEKVSVTSSIQNYSDIGKLFTDYSQSFTIPASPTNNAIFSHWYESEVDGGYDARIRYNAFLEIDTVNRTTRTFGDIAGGGLSVGASLHPNGYAYTSPNASLVIYKFGGGNTLDPNYPLSREINIL